MLKTVFTANLNEKIAPGKVSIGKFDGIHPCIVAVTGSDKILIHNPHWRSRSNETKLNIATATDINYLNLSQIVKCLATGTLKPNSDNDILVVGTPTSVLVYDVLNNKDVFYREIPDGANSVIVGYIGNIERCLVIAGGNCAIQGLDYENNDCYWTVTGDNITALALSDIDSDGQNELIVGSEDCDLRVFKDDAIFIEMSETDTIKCVCPLINDSFAYALNNGTVGVYQKKERIWRIKSKNQAISIIGYDLNGDNIPELITGWSSGKLDVRNIETGEVIFKDNFTHSIAAIMIADYNMDGIKELIVCSTSGEIRGYVPNTVEEKSFVTNNEQDTIRELMKRKQNLLIELRNYENNILVAESEENDILSKASTEEDEFGAIPANTQLKSSLILNLEDKKPCVELSLQTTNETIIRVVVIFAEGIFNGESYVIHPNESEVSGNLNIPLRPSKDIPVDLHIKSMVGYKYSHHFHVFELIRHLPRFSMYALKKSIHENSKPKSCVKFILNEKIQKIISWINRNFLMVEEIAISDNLYISFISLRDNKILIMEMISSTGEFIIRTDNMELAGEIVQALVNEFLKLSDLRSVANFPNDIENLKKLISKVDEIQVVKQQLGANIAENSSAIRTLVMRAEDSRLLGEWKRMRQFYMDLHNLNHELVQEYKIRSQSHHDLVDSLKQINVIIQKAANLRVGPSKTKIIQMSRLAIKENNLDTLSRILTNGEI